MKHSSPLLIATLLCLTSPIAQAYYFEDGFESGDQLSTNSDGFYWDGNNGTAVFNSNGMLWKRDIGTQSPEKTSYTAANGWSWSKTANSKWSAKNGASFLNFIYTPAKGWVENRFQLGTVQRDVWIQYWIRVPTNFYYRTKEEAGTTTDNNKFINLWMDDYSAKGTGTTIAFGLKPDTNNPGSALIDLSYSPGELGNGTGSKLSQYGERHFKNSTKDHHTAGHEKQTRFISYPSDKGRWMHMVFHIRAESSLGAGDGVMESWRMWEGQSAHSKLQTYENAAIKLPDNGKTQGFIQGYLMGHANSVPSEQTEWLIDDFKLSSAKPVFESDNAANNVAAPRAPNQIQAQQVAK